MLLRKNYWLKEKNTKSERNPSQIPNNKRKKKKREKTKQKRVRNKRGMACVNGKEQQEEPCLWAPQLGVKKTRAAQHIKGADFVGNWAPHEKHTAEQQNDR